MKIDLNNLEVRHIVSNVMKEELNSSPRTSHVVKLMYDGIMKATFVGIKDDKVIPKTHKKVMEFQIERKTARGHWIEEFKIWIDVDKFTQPLRNWKLEKLTNEVG